MPAPLLISICDRTNPSQMIGFFDIFPLTSAAGDRFINGQLTELDILKPEHICQKETAKDSDYIYIGTVLSVKGKSNEERYCQTCSLIPTLIRFVRREP
jgi:hypothetical protein